MKRMTSKKIAVLTLIFFALFIVAGCSSDSGANTTQSGYKDGTYEGRSPNGIGGEIAVSVEIADGKIADVKVLSHSETEGIGSIAVEQLPAKIVEAQSTEVEAVSGASVSSAAIKEAVNDALAKAK